MYNSQEQLSSIIHKFSHLKAIPPKMENSKLTCDVHNEYKYRAYIISSRLIVHKAILLKPTKKNHYQKTLLEAMASFITLLTIQYKMFLYSMSLEWDRFDKLDTAWSSKYDDFLNAEPGLEATTAGRRATCWSWSNLVSSGLTTIPCIMLFAIQRAVDSLLMLLIMTHLYMMNGALHCVNGTSLTSCMY